MCSYLGGTTMSAELDGESPRAREETVPLDATATAASATHHAESAYLLVFEGDSSWVFPLSPGDVVIGRADDAGLHLTDHAASRQHAKITTTQGEVRLADLNSQNGTFVNGERLTGSRALASGDTICVGGAALVFHSGPRRQASKRVVELSRFQQRCDEEVERSRRSHRPWSLAVLHLGVGLADRPAINTALAGHLRRTDLATWYGGDRLLLLLVESDAEQALAATQRLLRALVSLAPQTKAGVASYPLDGLDLDTLLASARTAAQAAESSQPARAATAYRTMLIGERRAIVADPAMSRLFAFLERLAKTDMPVLICGETGTGKEVAAAALHSFSPRRDQSFVALNCAAVPENLIESELFGYERGAFSGASTSKPGLIETAAGGTLLLDEVAELPASAQAKLLRFLEARCVRRLGEVRERELDVRIVAATNRNLGDEVEAKRFRQDLYFRLKGATAWIPPLRDRKAELPILAQAFLGEACARVGRPPMAISPEAMESLALHPWPGNVRELRNLMEYAAAMVKEPVLEHWHLAKWIAGEIAEEEAPASGVSARFRPIREEIRDLEKSRMLAALAATDGNRTRAAELIGMPLRTFVTKLRAYDLQQRNGYGRKPA
jgi:DNA-binding NtrC family response regulator